MDNTHDYLGANSPRNVYQNDSQQGGKSRQPGRQKRGAGVSHVLLLVALFAIPFVFIPIAGWGVAAGKAVVMALLVTVAGAFVFSSVRGGALVLPKIYSTLLLCLFVLTALSTMFSESIAASFFGEGLEVGTFFTTAIAIALAFVAPLVLTSRKRLVAALMSLFAGGMVLALFHLVRLILGPEALTFGYFNEPVSTPAGSWNDLGIFFGVVYLISLTSVMFGNLSSRARGLLFTAIWVSLAFVALVNFQLLSIVLGVVTLVVLLCVFISRQSQALFPAVGSFVFLVLLSLFTVPVGSWTGGFFNTTYTEIRPSWSSTTSMVGAGLSDFKNTTLGQGPNTFTYLWQQERAGAVVESNFWSVDFAFAAGIIPTFIVTFGLITVLLMLALVAHLAERVYGAMRDDPTNSLLTTIVAASGTAAIFLWVLAFFYVFSVMPFFLMFALSGIAVAALTQARRVSVVRLDHATLSGKAVGFAGVLVCLVLILPALLVGVSRTIYGQGVAEANAAEDVDELTRAQSKLLQASVLERNDDFARVETEIGLVRISEFLSRESGSEESAAEIELIVEATERAARRARTINPRDYLNWVNSGLVYETLGLLGVNNGFELAEQSYALAQELNPTNPELKLIQARLARTRENTEDAVALAEEALALKPNYEDAHLFLADVAIANDDIAGAIRRLETGAEAVPQSALINYQLGLVHYTEDDYGSALESFNAALTLDPSYANVRYYRALALVYGEDDREAALADLERLRENNLDNSVLASVISNVEAGDDPLEGIAEDVEVLPSESDEATPATNIETVDDLGGDTTDPTTEGEIAPEGSEIAQ